MHFEEFKVLYISILKLHNLNIEASEAIFSWNFGSDFWYTTKRDTFETGYLSQNSPNVDRSEG